MRLVSSLTFLQLVVIAVVSIEWSTIGSPITVTSFQCTKGEKLCRNMTCNMVMSRNRVPFFNMGCLLPHPVFNTTAEVTLFQQHGEKYEIMVKSKENMCAAANKMLRSQMMERVIQTMQKYFTGFKCPFEGNVTAIRMPLKLNFVPGFMPATSYKLLIDVRDLDDLVLLVDLKFQIGKTPLKGEDQ